MMASNIQLLTAQKIDSNYYRSDFFQIVQKSGIYKDSKTFVDAIPIIPINKVLDSFDRFKNLKSFSLEAFSRHYFKTIDPIPSKNKIVKNQGILKHIKVLWNVLNRKPDTMNVMSSLIPLPHPYVVPGGRFREIYYWDTYFTMLGLEVDNRWDIIENMVHNFNAMLDSFGFIPNGNRTYYLKRSQPPFYSLMLDIYSKKVGSKAYTQNIDRLVTEWNYWMDQTYNTQHVVKMPDGSILNRYWGRGVTPREESYLEDYSMANNDITNSFFYRNIRSGAESGWDFSSRWCRIPNQLSTIEITNIVPIDLNCLLWHLEQTIANTYQIMGNSEKASDFRLRSEKRFKAIKKYCYNKKTGWFFDYNIRLQTMSDKKTLAGFFPAYFKMISDTTFEKCKNYLQYNFLKSGGFITTLNHSGQQWDAPNGWAPLQWVCVKGLRNYGSFKLAKEGAKRWMKTNIRVYKKTGKMMEKYNVEVINLKAGGGEYPAQDGFGWTNGVFMKMHSIYGLP